jgi:hypothetical protein
MRSDARRSVAYGPASSTASASAFGVGLRLAWGLRPVTGASCQVAQPVLYLVHSPAGGFPAPSGRGLPADRRGARVGLGSFFWHCGRDAFLSGRAWFGACLHVGAVFGVIRCAWHGFMHGRPGTARVAGARARGQAGQQKPGCQAPVIFSRPPPRGRASPHIQLTSRRAPACRRPPASGWGLRLRLALLPSCSVWPAFAGLAGKRFTSALRAQFPRGPASSFEVERLCHFG